MPSPSPTPPRTGAEGAEGAVTLHGRRFAPLLSAGDIAARIGELGGELARLLAAEAPPAGAAAAAPILLGVLNGAAIFHADLARAYASSCELAYLRASSYAGTASTGEVRIAWPEGLDVSGRAVVVVEDIADSGLTLATLRDTLLGRGAARVVSAVLLDKPAGRTVDFAPDLTGFVIPDRFVVGFGLDYDGLGRNLRGVYALAEADA